MSLAQLDHRPRSTGTERRGSHALSPRRAALEVERGALLIDIRSARDRRRQGDVPGARPLDLIGAPIGESDLPIDAPGERGLVLLSATGRRAASAAAALERPGVEVWFVDGGVRGWELAGLPVHAYRHGDVSSR